MWLAKKDRKWVGWFVLMNLAHGERLAMQGMAIESLEGPMGFFRRGHREKRETVWTAGFPVANHERGQDGSRTGEKKLKIALPGFEGKIAHVEFRGHEVVVPG